MWLSTRFFENLLSFIFPDRCFGCGTKGILFCSACTKKSRIPNTLGENEAPLTYETNAAQKSLWAFKYKGVQRLAEPFGKILHDHLLEIVSEAFEFYPGKRSPIVLVPIPLHASRKRERGYNQSTLLAEEIVRISPDVFILREETLIKTRATKPQATCSSRTERLKNLKDSYELNPKVPIKGEIIVLIDDVLTTGSTIKEAARTLQKGRPAEVYKVALMRAGA